MLVFVIKKPDVHYLFLAQLIAIFANNVNVKLTKIIPLDIFF